MHTRRPLAAPALAITGLALLASAAACAREEARPPAADRGRLHAATSQRASLRVLGATGDTLSDSARVTLVAVEPDGDAVAFVFADPASGAIAGLGLSQRGGPAQLLWPDSVRAVWWARDHALAFTTSTGIGARIVVDVHAATMSILEERADSIRPPARSAPIGAGARARAVKYIDSLRFQPAGTPQRSSLRYLVSQLLPSPVDSTVAMFYAAATDSVSGTRSNPAWYALDAATGTVILVDQLVGPATEMPGEAAGWSTSSSGGGRFVYAKGLTLWEVEPKRAP